MAKRTPSKHKTKSLKCKKGSFPVEIEIGKKKVIVCGRLTAEDIKKVKKEFKKKSKDLKTEGAGWLDWTFGVLDILSSGVQAFHH
jgi:hypothetical protein